MLSQKLNKLKLYFFEEMEEQTSGLLYGSSITGDWVPARSDLDVIIYLNSKKNLDQFTQQYNKWRETESLELLDGFLLFTDDDLTLKTIRFYNFSEQPKSISESILLPDQWKINSESKPLFGEKKIQFLFPEVKPESLKLWAIENKLSYWIPSLKESIKSLNKKNLDDLLPMNESIWVATGAARICTLGSSGLCSSKQESLQWLIDKNNGPVNLFRKLLDFYNVPDSEAPKLSTEEVIKIFNYSLEILQD